MNYNDIPDFDAWTAWTTADQSFEVKLEKNGDTVLHLSEDDDAASDQIEDGKFYFTPANSASGLIFVREREAFEMDYDDSFSPVVDADYVELWSNGRFNETQHNHEHLDYDVSQGHKIALTPV